MNSANDSHLKIAAPLEAKRRFGGSGELGKMADLQRAASPPAQETECRQCQQSCRGRLGHGDERESAAARRNQLLAKLRGEAIQRCELACRQRGIGRAKILGEQLEIAEVHVPLQFRIAGQRWKDLDFPRWNRSQSIGPVGVANAIDQFALARVQRGDGQART